MITAAITGWAWATPLGTTIDGVFGRLLAGERAARPNPLLDARTYRCQLAAAISEPAPQTPHDRILRRMGRFGYHVAREAAAHAQLVGGPRIGLYCGIGGLRAHWNDMMPALAGQADDLADGWRRGLRKLHPFWMLQHLSNNAHALLSRDLGCRGEGVTFGGAVAGAEAIAAACEALADGAIDAALVVAYDSLLEPETLVALGARGTAAVGDDPAAVGAPYCASARGFVPGEAAAALVLAPAGDQRALAHVAAATATDGTHDSAGAAAIAAAWHQLGPEAGPSVDQFDLVDGAALADPTRDAAERALAGERCAAHLTAAQSALGQLGAAATLVQIITTATALRRGEAPPIAGATEAAPGPLTPLVHATPISARNALCLSAGAPGLAAAALVTA